MYIRYYYSNNILLHLLRAEKLILYNYNVIIMHNFVKH